MHKGKVALKHAWRRANGRDAQFAAMLGCRRQHLADFWRRKRHRVVGADDVALQLPGVALHARREIDGNDLRQRKPAVDFADDRGHRAFGRTTQPGAEQRIDHDGREMHVARDRGGEGTTGDPQHAEVLGRLALHVVRIAGEHYIEALRLEAGVDLPGDDEAVAAIVAFAAADHHRAATPQANQHFGGAAPRVLHQHHTGNAQFFDGPPVELANFLTAEIHGLPAKS